MSLKSRAKALAKTTGVSYQQAVQQLRDAGEEPAELRAISGWTMHRADVVSVAPAFDEEYSEVVGSGSFEIENCENCGQGYFQCFDKKGMQTGGSAKFCPGCMDEYGSWECPRCGEEVLGFDEEGVCASCWRNVMSKD